MPTTMVSWVPKTATTCKERLETIEKWTLELVTATWIPVLALAYKVADVDKIKGSDAAKDTGKSEE